MPATSRFYFYGFFVVVSEWLAHTYWAQKMLNETYVWIHCHEPWLRAETKRLEFELIAFILLIISVQFIPPNGRYQLNIEFFILCAIWHRCTKHRHRAYCACIGAQDHMLDYSQRFSFVSNAWKAHRIQNVPRSKYSCISLSCFNKFESVSFGLRYYNNVMMWVCLRGQMNGDFHLIFDFSSRCVSSSSPISIFSSA